MSGRGSGVRNSSGSSMNSGRGRGGGGRGKNSNGGRGRGSEHSQNNVKQDRKAGRRATQLEAMEKKAKEEDDYFRQCQDEAARQRRKYGGTDIDSDGKRQRELFSKQGAQGINFKKYDEIKVEVKLPNGSNISFPVMQSFDDLALPTQLKKNVSLMNYKQPTPIQRNAIPLSLVEGEDLMCCAQTGSGKTLAFLLPVCAALASSTPDDDNNNGHRSGNRTKLQPASPRCVVLAPTRELASQIELEAQKLTYGIPSVVPVCVYGGASPRSQLRQLAFASAASTALLIVATPGRLSDFVDRDIVSLSDVQFLILDEADRMLDVSSVMSCVYCCQ